MTSESMPANAIFMTASQKPIHISSTSMQRAEQLMSQVAMKTDDHEQLFDDHIDDDELCRACDECDQLYQASQELSTPTRTGGVKRKRLGVSTTPNERRTMIKRN